MDDNAVGAISIITIFVLFPLVLGVTRYLWKRGSEPSRPSLPNDTAIRIIQMQQSIDAMAVELERISENQRFVTKLLSDREKPSSQLKGGQ